jgi:tetratricopeptide (TPR) repeat protein
VKVLLPSSNKCLPICLAAALLLGGCGSTPSRQEGASAASAQQKLPRDYEQALSLMRSGDYGAAVPVLQKFSEDNPKLAGPYVNLGIAYTQLGEPGAALVALDKAVALNPASAAAQLQRGIVFRERGDFQAALGAYDKALSLQPDYALAHRNIGILYDIYLQQPAKALTHYKRYMELANGDDKTVNGWIIDLERRSGSATASATQ